MKIFHITFASTGGAGIAAYRFYKMQQATGKDVEFISRVKKLSLFSLFRNPIISLSAFFDYFITKRPSIHFFSVFRAKIVSKDINRIRNSIVHIHWFPGLGSIFNLKHLSKNNSKVFIHLHDIWFLTGGCHHSISCKRYPQGCNACPFVKSPFRHLVTRAQSQKLNFLMEDNVFLIAPSTWIRDQIDLANPELSTKSYLISNPINIDEYKVIDKSLAKKILGIDPNQIVLGFVAANLNDANKGIQNMVQELEKSPVLRNLKITIIFVGSGNITTNINNLKIKYSSSKSRLSIAYSAMDIFINSSIVESFSYTNIEASLHKTPVLSIENGGSQDTICENVSGFVFNSSSELILKITELVSNEHLLNAISDTSRRFVVDNFSNSIIDKKLTSLYDS